MFPILGGKPLPVERKSRVQSRRALRAEVVRRSVSAMDYHTKNCEMDAAFCSKGELDTWPGNISRMQTSHTFSEQGSPPPSTQHGLNAPTRPAVLDHIEGEIRGQLSVLAARFPQFRRAALLLPFHLAIEEGEEPVGIDVDSEAARWWDDAGQPRRPAVVLEPQKSDAYISAASQGRDVFAADRLNVFRSAAKHLCTEFRTYQGVLRSIFIEYDRYIQFCNEFVLEERSALMRVQEEMTQERTQLLKQIAQLQDETLAAQSKASDAEVREAAAIKEAAVAKQALEDSITKVSLVDKIIADAEADKGILARKLIQAEREAQALSERLKAPEKKIHALQVQLENKETLLKDISRRYERSCNNLDSLKKQLKAEQELERKQEEERKSSRNRSMGASRSTVMSGANATLIRDLNERATALQLKCQLLESQLNTLHQPGRAAPIASDIDDSMGGSGQGSAASSPRTARRQSPRDAQGNSAALGITAKGAAQVTALPTKAAPQGGGRGSTNVVDSAAFVSQLGDVHPNERVRFCIETVSLLLADLAEARAALDAVTGGSLKSGPAESLLSQRVINGTEDPLCRFFVGSEPDHPSIFLRASGRVRNQKFSLMSLKTHIYGFFADASAMPRPERSVSERFLEWMRRRYAEETNTMCFSFFKALSWFPEDMDAYLFHQLLEDKVPEDFWKQPYVIVNRLREMFEKLSFRHGGAVIPRTDVHQVLSTELAAWDLLRVEDVCAIVTSEEVEWRKLFLTSKGLHEPLLTHIIRKHWLSEVLTFRNELLESILEDPQSGAGHVTPLTFVRALLSVDRDCQESKVLELVGQLFGAAAVEEVAEQGSVPLRDRFTLSTASMELRPLFAVLAAIPLLRSCRREKRSGGIYGLKRLKDEQNGERK